MELHPTLSDPFPCDAWLEIWRQLSVQLRPTSQTVHHFHGLSVWEMTPHHFPDHQTRVYLERLASYAAVFQTAEAAFGPELYEHTCLISPDAVQIFFERRTNLPPLSHRPLWIKHLDLILSPELVKCVDWQSTTSVWSTFTNLKTITIAYKAGDLAPLVSYVPIGSHLPPSVELLLLRPYGEADGEAQPEYEPWVRGPPSSKTRPFWLQRVWSEHLSAFGSIPHIHIHTVEYVVWPPFSHQQADKVGQQWVKNFTPAGCSTLSASVIPYNAGEALMQELEEKQDAGVGVDALKQAGYLPLDATDIEGYDLNGSELFYYDWKLTDGAWKVEIPGPKAELAVTRYAQFSYHAGGFLDQKVLWD